MATREQAIAAVAARLTTQCPTATVERARRAPVDTDTERLPRLVVTAVDWQADNTVEPLVIHNTLSLAVTGYAKAKTDVLAEQALGTLHALVVAALSGWTPSVDGLGDLVDEGADFLLIDAEDSKAPAGEFTARFSMLVLAPMGA